MIRKENGKYYLRCDDCFVEISAETQAEFVNAGWVLDGQQHLCKNCKRRKYRGRKGRYIW